MKIPLRLWKAKFSLKTNLGRLGAWNCHGNTMFFLDFWITLKPGFKGQVEWAEQGSSVDLQASSCHFLLLLLSLFVGFDLLHSLLAINIGCHAKLFLELGQS